ncbi:putative protein phosphatase 2C-like protein 44 [Cannabis sativa]|uniref:putative protein phosphatase 2C-like protein 44 n=1 Tax=Cannabis sativa TaxID=3483 RepID=UPI0029CA31CF|nr:putative protein phosphatase 2C-like protein 44 [Cannabis sativa]
MALKDLPFKLKGFRLKRLPLGEVNKKKKKKREVRICKPSWMTPISHGYHVVESTQSIRVGSDESEADSVVVQREQFDQLEVWFFGVSDAKIGDGVNNYIQSHFMDKKPKEIRRRSKETMKKAYMGVRGKMRETIQKTEERAKAGSVSVMVINGDKLVIGNIGEYKAVVCKNGVARYMNPQHKHFSSPKPHWSGRFLSVRMLSCHSGNNTMQSKSSEVLVGVERVDSDTEFVILASTGIWEAMKPQEAVNLTRHLEDPQEAAECLAKEAITRMSKTNISCLIIRFD